MVALMKRVIIIRLEWEVQKATNISSILVAFPNYIIYPVIHAGDANA